MKEVETITLTVDPGQQPLRLDKFLSNRLQRLSRSRIQEGIKDGLVTVNGETVKPNHKVLPGDTIEVAVPPKRHETSLKAEDIPLSILYEDDDVLVINKPVGLVVHPGIGNYSGTLVNALKHHLGDTLPGKDPARAGLVHRLDKDTSGVLVTAKSDIAMTHLSKQFYDRTINRRYVALVWGNVEQDEGTIDANIGRDPRNPICQAVFPRGDEGKRAITHYKVLERFAYVTLLSCKLETGRTHQIRVHLRYIGHTLFNDERYGGDTILKGTVYSKYKQFVQNCFSLLPTQALHAASLGFEHPRTGKPMFFEAPLPSNFSEVLEKWRRFTKDAIRKRH